MGIGLQTFQYMLFDTHWCMFRPRMGRKCVWMLCSCEPICKCGTFALASTDLL